MLRTFISDELFQPIDDQLISTVLPAEVVEGARILSATCTDGASWNDEAGHLQGEMDLWVRPNAVQFSAETLSFDKRHLNELGAIQQDIGSYIVTGKSCREKTRWMHPHDGFSHYKRCRRVSPED